MKIIAGLISLSIAVYLSTFLVPLNGGECMIEFSRRNPALASPYHISSLWLWAFILYGIYCIILGEYDDFQARGARKARSARGNAPE